MQDRGLKLVGDADALTLLRRVTFALTGLPPTVTAGDPDPKEQVQKVVKAAGGEDKLLKLFRIKERLNVSSDPAKKGGERISILEPPGYWWQGKVERVKEQKEPATFLVWAWER